MRASFENLTVQLSSDEQVLAGLLTRDAWTYFSSLIGTESITHVKEIPLTPRRGVLEITSDPEVVHYYLCFADAYSDELAESGWDKDRCNSASESFIGKLESASGITRGGRLLSGDKD